MNKNRLEAFSDGVIAIVITIMVFDIKAPSDSSWVGFAEIAPSILTYVMSFLYLGIYWNNHHHMLQVTDRISGTVLWANTHLLFWLTLLPPSTAGCVQAISHHFQPRHMVLFCSLLRLHIDCLSHP
jgi:uncharacterized membrane protein